jgi:beta-lactam-binding protein with PASTA domain
VFKKITEKPLWVNILIALGLVLVLCLLFFFSLSYITKHNRIIKVPSVVGMNLNDALKSLEAQGFTVEVQDSVYLDDQPRLAVIKQTPEGDAVVKTNRTIYLTVNRAVPPVIEMPDLRGYSITSAELLLKSLGLKVGDTIYKPDIARNAVLDQLLSGQSIKPGTKLNMGAAIDLVLGDGVGNASMDVPVIVGMTYSQAISYLSSMNISIGAVVNDPDVSDNTNAYIYKQSPEKYSEPLPGQRVTNKIKAGQVIDVWLSNAQPAKPQTDTTTQQQPQ